MSIFKRLYGRPIPTKMEATTETATQATAPATTEVPTVITTENVPAATETTTPAAAETTTPAPTMVAPTTNGGPRFHFGAKAKMFRDMIAQHKWHKPAAAKFDSEQTQFIGYQCLIALVCMCFVVGVSTAHWECEGSQCFGFWNTCQKQTALMPADMGNGTGIMENTTMPTMTTIMCLYYKYQNHFEMVVAEQLRIDQVTIAQVLVVAGSIMCVLSLVVLAMAYHFIKAKRFNCMRNTLVVCIFMVVVTYMLHLIGMYFYLMTERFSSSVTCLFVYFGFAFMITNVINLFTIEYKAYKMRQVQVQQ